MVVVVVVIVVVGSCMDKVIKISRFCCHNFYIDVYPEEHSIASIHKIYTQRLRQLPEIGEVVEVQVSLLLSYIFICLLAWGIILRYLLFKS